MKWQPPLSAKQYQLFNMGIKADSELRHPNAAPAILVSGARYSGKTLGVIHRIFRHLWDTPDARACIVSKTIKSMTDAGTFREMIEKEAPKWIDSHIGFEFTTRDFQGTPGPKQDSKTRTVMFRVRNRHGGESELQLQSLNHDHEVEAIFKGTVWSCIWFSEFSLFKTQRVFTTAMFQLRMQHLARWQHLFIADTNPAEEGEEHWIYKLWYTGRFEDEETEKDPDSLEYKKSLRLIEFFLEDNPWLTDGELKVIKSRYKNDPGEYAREVDGQWVQGHGNRGKHFADVFFPHVHVVGSDAPEEDQIIISDTTKTLYGGWDIGSSMNHSAHILENRTATINGIDYSDWCVIDELLVIADQIQVKDFALMYQAKMREVENQAGRKFDWEHYSDDTALNVYRTSGAGYDALEVEIATKGEIKLQGVTKPEGSVRARVRILRRLLKENRIWTSARCKATHAMYRDLHQGTTQKEYVAWNVHKHPFDSLTYPILIVSGNELLDEVFRPQASPQKVRVISV